MKHRNDFQPVPANTVGDDVRGVGGDELPRSDHPAWAAHFGLCLEEFHCGVLAQEEMEARARFLTDPPNARAEALKGLEAVKQGDYIDLSGDVELREFFEDVVARGRKRLEGRGRRKTGR